ncbi:hypothetical protein [Leptospira jelokensis]|uniref:hypothetical protein n=1 Tax=Leptospira jelokensis TaxID=2484931 RepID=UPI001090AD95|nr:hypothetical protein [Leptospira jelokensis]TGL97938.1 hypothetical protein EHQ79_19010 [Leptospira jelokensis]
MLAGLFLQESKPPSVYTGTMVAGQLTSPSVYGYDLPNNIGSISPSLFEGITISGLIFFGLQNHHRLYFTSAPPVMNLKKIKINGTEYNLTVASSTLYTFGPSSSLFSNGQSYTIEFIR